MKSILLFEEFKIYCKEYEIELGNLIIRSGDNEFKLFKPFKDDELLFESSYGKSRIQGIVSNIEELLEEAQDVVPDKLNINSNVKYM